jgi:hypothetical protein
LVTTSLLEKRKQLFFGQMIAAFFKKSHKDENLYL